MKDPNFKKLVSNGTIANDVLRNIDNNFQGQTVACICHKKVCADRGFLRHIFLVLSSLVVVNIYRPPSGQIPSFLHELKNLIGTVISDFSDKILPCSDINCFGLYGTCIDDGRVVESYGLQSLVHEPIRDWNILDRLASDGPVLLSDELDDNAGLISDHRLIHSKLRMNRPSCQPVERKIHLPAFESALSRPVFFQVQGRLFFRCVHQPTRRDRRCWVGIRRVKYNLVHGFRQNQLQSA